MSTIHAPDFYGPRRKWRTKKRDEFIRENVGIDTAILADGLGVSERFIISYQRKLGVRRFVEDADFRPLDVLVHDRQERRLLPRKIHRMIDAVLKVVAELGRGSRRGDALPDLQLLLLEN